MKGLILKKQQEKTRVSNFLNIAIPVLFAIVFLGFVIWCSVGIFSAAGDLVEVTGTLIDHACANENITAGIVINKEIVNGHSSHTAGGIVAGSNGTSGIVIGGNNGYVPTQYRLYVNGEYELDGEIFEGETYYDVPAEVYQAYNIGDFFDSQNFKGIFSGDIACPNCGSEWSSTYCGDCGAPMNIDG